MFLKCHTIKLDARGSRRKEDSFKTRLSDKPSFSMLCPRKGAILVLKEFIKQNIGGNGCYSERDILEPTSLAPTLVNTPL